MSAPLSPELVLVDHELAAQARTCLSQADDTLARIELLVRAHRIAESRSAFGGLVSSPTMVEPAPDPPAAPRPFRRRVWTRSGPAAVVGAVAAASFATALLIGVRIDVRGNPAGADTSSIGRPPPALTTPSRARLSPAPTAASSATPKARAATTPNVKRTATPRTRPRTQAPSVERRFVWAPVRDASGYEVEFFRGGKLFFSSRTPLAEIRVPATWTLGGKRRSFGPGEYQWYVWPLRGGLRAPTAIVQARLVVPHG